MQHLHTDCKRELVPLFIKVRKVLLGSKLKEDAVERVQVVTLELAAQSPEQIRLFWGELFAAEIVSIRHSDTSMMTAAYSLNRVRAHEFRYIAPNCHLGNINFACQIILCIMPSVEKHFQ